MKLNSINPANQQLVHEYAVHSQDEIDDIIEHAHLAHLQWKQTLFSERSALLHTVAQKLQQQKGVLAELATMEMGKPIAEAESEIEKCAWVCRYYADHAEKFLSDETIETEAQESYVRFDPLGVVLAVMPWNFPYWQVFRFAAPALMAGNTCVLKHASNVSGCALAIENLLGEAGLPQHTFRTLLVPGKELKEVICHPRIKAITLTGSTEAGKSVAKIAGEQLKKTVLELGGSDPYIILEDANIEQAAKLCADSRLINSGQSCIGAKRFIVVNKIKSQFESAFVNHMRAARMGDPMDRNNRVGPMAREDLRDELHRQVSHSVKQGATCLLGGEIPEMQGAYYPPTVITNVDKTMPAYAEELFGPAATIIGVENEIEAVQVANDSLFGLGAAVFTADTEKGKRIADRLEAGCCVVNDFVKSDPRLPFGGIKGSGYGRELSHYGIKEFVNIKTIVVESASS